jgi:hypothetical protein
MIVVPLDRGRWAEITAQHGPDGLTRIRLRVCDRDGRVMGAAHVDIDRKLRSSRSQPATVILAPIILGTCPGERRRA